MPPGLTMRVLRSSMTRLKLASEGHVTCVPMIYLRVLCNDPLACLLPLCNLWYPARILTRRGYFVHANSMVGKVRHVYARVMPSWSLITLALHLQFAYSL